MRSYRKWLLYVALGVALIVCGSDAMAQVPQGFTYQGMLEENGVPANETVTITASISDRTNDPIWTETIVNVKVFNGIFNLVIGAPISPINFNEQYSLEIVVTDNSNNSTTLSPSALWSAPYAINSSTVNGISASSVPIAGNLFPVPVGAGYVGHAKIDPGFLPNAIPNNLLSSAAMTTINNVVPNGSGNVSFVGGNGVTIATGSNSIDIKGATAVGNKSTVSVALTVRDSATNSNKALVVNGGIGANNSTGVDGTGLTPNSPQTSWGDQVSVPASTTTSLQIYNQLVSATSTIVVSPIERSASVVLLTIISQGSGMFTVEANSNMGTGMGGIVTGISYFVVNH